MRYLISLIAVFFASSGTAKTNLSFQLFLPDGDEPTPLVVMLHGCKQTATEFRSVTAFDAVANKHNFAVLYPNQPDNRNPLRCWNWYSPPGSALSSNEADLIVDAINTVITNHPRIQGPIFAAGLSAGAAMSGYLVTCYPEKFKAAVLHSGVSYRRARTGQEALVLMKWGAMAPLLRKPNCPGFTRKPILAIQGTQDETVSSSNADIVLSDLSDRSPLSAKLNISSLPHAWSGGAEDHSYSFPESLPASMIIADYFRKLLP